MNGRRICISAIIFSAVLTAMAFLCARFCWWFIFVCFIPLFYVAVAAPNPLSFFYGFIWGFFFFGLHMYGLLRVIFDWSAGRLGILLWLILIIYCSTLSGFVFWFGSLCSRHSERRCIQQWCWVGVVFFLFWIVENIILCILGHFEGYPLGYLLLPLASCPRTLYLLPYLGSSALILLVVLCNYFIFLFIYLLRQYTVYKFLKWSRAICYFMAICICFIPFIWGVLASQSGLIIIPSYLDHLIVFIPLNRPQNPLDSAQDIADQLTTCIEKKPNADVVIMPESSYPFPLNEYLQVIRLWSDSLLSDNIKLILGSHFRRSGRLYNTLFCIQNCRITQSYDKKHTIPFVEYIPEHLNNISILQNLFLCQKEQIYASQLPRKILLIRDDMCVAPYICSELFFGFGKPSNQTDTILCIANDSWFSSHAMRELLLFLAYYRALQWQKNIIYITHHYAQWIDKNGRSDALNVLYG